MSLGKAVYVPRFDSQFFWRMFKGPFAATKPATAPSVEVSTLGDQLCYGVFGVMSLISVVFGEVSISAASTPQKNMNIHLVSLFGFEIIIYMVFFPAHRRVYRSIEDVKYDELGRHQQALNLDSTVEFHFDMLGDFVQIIHVLFGLF